MAWEEETLKFVFHIADAPPHGEMYHGGELDFFPEGCPCKINLDDTIDLMREKKIIFHMIKMNDKLNIFR